MKKKNIAKDVTETVKKLIKTSMQKDELSEGFLGGCVIAAIFLAGFIGAFFILTGPVDSGKAVFQGKECFCRNDGLYERVTYFDGEVMRADGMVQNIGTIDNELPVCAQVCARIGLYV